MIFRAPLLRGEVEGVVLSVRGCVTVFLSVGERSIETLSAAMSVYGAVLSTRWRRGERHDKRMSAVVSVQAL